MDPSAIPSFPTPAIIAENVICQLLGTMFNWALFGCMVVQFHYYYTTFLHDRIAVRALIYAVFVAELLQVIMLTEHSITTFGTHFGNFAGISKVRTAWFCVPFLTSILSGTVQLFLIHRIHVLSGTWMVPVALALLSAVHSVSGITTAVLGHTVGDFTRFQEPGIKVTGTLWVCSGAASDILIAAALSFYLSRLRTGFQKTETLLNRMIKLSIETGSLTATMQLAMTILFLACPGKSYYLVLAFCLGKVYGINLFMIQNSRESIVYPSTFTTNTTSSVSTTRTKPYRPTVVAVQMTKSVSRGTVIPYEPSSGYDKC